MHPSRILPIISLLPFTSREPRADRSQCLFDSPKKQASQGGALVYKTFIVDLSLLSLLSMAEDAVMETCPSPETGDSRKRPLDSDPENEQTKRSHFSSASTKLKLPY